MSGQDFIEEIDCSSFFDHIDDLIEFPQVNDTSLDSVECNEFNNIWTSNGTHDLQVSDPIFGAGNSDSASALSAELAVPYEDIVQLEWLSNFVEDSFSGGGMTINKETVPVQKETVVRHQFQTSSPVSVLESSSSSSSSSSGPGGGGGGATGTMIPLSPIQRGPQRARSKRPRPATFNPRAMIELLSPMIYVPVSASSESEKNFASRCGPNLVIRGPDEKKQTKQRKPKILGPTEEFGNQNENQNHSQNQSGGQGVRKPIGPKDPLQCLWCSLQVRAAVPRVSACSQSNFYSYVAFELP
nr:GATA transcription factor 8-like [Tanacetum cinerariifolium]